MRRVSKQYLNYLPLNVSTCRAYSENAPRWFSLQIGNN